MQPSDNKVKRLDNHRIFRPEAVEAHTTRRAGEPWDSRTRAEAAILAALTILAIAALLALRLGGH